MTAQELVEQLQRGSGDELVMVRTEDGKMHSVRGVEFDYHDDADRSTTVWIGAEEY